jgi:hypothetical protein
MHSEPIRMRTRLKMEYSYCARQSITKLTASLQLFVMTTSGRLRLVGEGFTYRYWVFRFPVPTATMLRFCAEPKIYIAMQAAKMVRDVVVSWGARREFVK